MCVTNQYTTAFLHFNWLHLYCTEDLYVCNAALDATAVRYITFNVVSGNNPTNLGVEIQ